MKIDILLIEDDPSAAFALNRLLSLRGLIAATAGTGEEARLMMDRHPRAVILDLMLPDIPGENLIPMLKARDRDVQIIVWSALPEGARLERVRDMGVHRILPKPLPDLETLMGALPSPR